MTGQHRILGRPHCRPRRHTRLLADGHMGLLVDKDDGARQGR